MKTRTVLIIVAIISIALILAGSLLVKPGANGYVTHWNAQGQPDGYSSAFTGLYLIPLMTLVFSFLIVGLTMIDPLKKNVDAFRPTVNGFILGFAVYMSYIHVLTLLWNMGVRFNMNQLISPAMGIFIFLAGSLLTKAKRNWFIGIRTPWTMSSDLVWEKTHQRGGLLFKIAGGIALLGIIFPNAAVWLLLAPILAVTAYTLVYSYVLYQQVARKAE